jgi:hypothetical protein
MEMELGRAPCSSKKNKQLLGLSRPNPCSKKVESWKKNCKLGCLFYGNRKTLVPNKHGQIKVNHVKDSIILMLLCHGLVLHV